MRLRCDSGLYFSLVSLLGGRWKFQKKMIYAGVDDMPPYWFHRGLRGLALWYHLAFFLKAHVFFVLKMWQWFMAWVVLACNQPCWLVQEEQQFFFLNNKDVLWWVVKLTRQVHSSPGRSIAACAGCKGEHACSVEHRCAGGYWVPWRSTMHDHGIGWLGVYSYTILTNGNIPIYKKKYMI